MTIAARILEKLEVVSNENAPTAGVSLDTMMSSKSGERDQNYIKVKSLLDDYAKKNNLNITIQTATEYGSPQLVVIMSTVPDNKQIIDDSVVEILSNKYSVTKKSNYGSKYLSLE